MRVSLSLVEITQPFGFYFCKRSSALLNTHLICLCCQSNRKICFEFSVKPHVNTRLTGNCNRAPAPLRELSHSLPSLTTAGKHTLPLGAPACPQSTHLQKLQGSKMRQLGPHPTLRGRASRRVLSVGKGGFQLPGASGFGKHCLPTSAG